jgi:hypothetical protein
VSQRQMYFAATGKPYQDATNRDTALMTDDYLKRHVVGQPVDGLSLVRSALSGDVHSDTLTSSLNWTFVFKNKTFEDQEARAELALPPGGVVSGLTLWINGKPNVASFGGKQAVTDAYNWVTVQHRDPALVTDLGNGRVLLQCSPIPVQGELKMKLTITAPMALVKADEATMVLPRIIDSNFSLHEEHSFKLSSQTPLTLALDGVRRIPGKDGEQLAGTLKNNELQGPSISIKTSRKMDFKPIVITDSDDRRSKYIQSVERLVVTSPSKLLVVLDGSKSMRPYLQEVIAALKKTPASVKASLIVAREGTDMTPVALQAALQQLKPEEFNGGEDNLGALLSAAALAGETQKGAVLWIHGPQIALNQELYIMEPSAFRPAFFEMALDNGFTNSTEFLKNYQEIPTPMSGIPHNTSVKEDLTAFLQAWNPGSFTYRVAYKDRSPWARPIKTGSPDAIREVVDAQRVAEISALRNKEKVCRLIAENRESAAVELASTHHIVTPVSGAVVLEQTSDYNRFDLKDRNSQPNSWTFTPIVFNPFGFARGALQQTMSSSFSTVVSQLNTLNSYSAASTGSSTTGSTRSATTFSADQTFSADSNSALNTTVLVLANFSLILLVGLGAINLLLGLFNKPAVFPFRLSAARRLSYGAAMVVLGLLIPSIINWLVASAHAANFFT